MYRRQLSRAFPRKRNAKRQNGLSEEALQIVTKRTEAEKQSRKGKIYPFECRVLKNSTEITSTEIISTRLPQLSMQRNRGKQ